MLSTVDRAARRAALYTSIVVTTKPPPSVPPLAPAMIAAALAVGSMLPVGSRSLRAAGDGETWQLAWAVALGLALVASMRRRWPAWSHPAAGGAWQLAGVLGAALLLRHAADTLALAAAEAPWSLGPFLGLDLAAWTVLGAILLLGVPVGSLRTVRPGLLVPSMIAVALALTPPALAGLDAGRPVTGDGSLLDAVLVAGALAWTAALVGPSSLPLRAARSVPDRAAPRVLLALLYLGLPAALLASARVPRLLLEGPSMLGAAGAEAWGGWGVRIASGMDAGASLLAALAILLLSARVSARRQLRLRPIAAPLMAAAAGLLAGLLPMPTLLVFAALSGWAALAVGVEVAPWVPAGREGIDP